MTQLCLVRHGITDWNLEGKYQGQSNVHLNDAGRIEVKKLAQQLKNLTFSAIYSSDLERAFETAEIIAKYLDLSIRIDPRLREINLGEWEGKNVIEIQSNYANLWKQRHQDPINARPPGGETLAEVATRVYTAIDEIASQTLDKSCIICSHGITLATIICKVRKINLGSAYEVIPDNAKPLWVNWNGKS
jgi:broad specificity phosphatase PhoE